VYFWLKIILKCENETSPHISGTIGLRLAFITQKFHPSLSMDQVRKIRPRDLMSLCSQVDYIGGRNVMFMIVLL
jgi:hypothetical protein